MNREKWQRSLKVAINCTDNTYLYKGLSASDFIYLHFCQIGRLYIVSSFQIKYIHCADCIDYIFTRKLWVIT